MRLDGADLLALLPLLVLSASSVVVMLAAAFWRRPAAVTGLALLGLVLSLAALPLAAGVAPRQVTPLLTIDGFALFYMGLVFAATLVVVVFAHAYYHGAAAHRRPRPEAPGATLHEPQRAAPHEAIHILVLLAALGSAVLVASSHFASFVLGLELLSVSLFALIAYPRETERPLEAGIKYLILAGVSSAFLLLGMAWIYAALGRMEFGAIGALLARGDGAHDVFMRAGLALILVGIGFKLALVPFHMWTPDVYEGAPAPVAAFVATVSKGAVIALLLRYFVAAGGYRSASIMLVLEAIAIASILAGNLLALLQDNVKRILAYSSIAHLGYLLVAFLATGPLAIEAVSYYLVAYFVTMLGAFGVVGLLSPGGLAPDTDRLADYRGLFWRRPWVAAVFAAMLLSLAGIPLTMGFVAKFYVLAAGVGAQLWLPVVVLVVGSAIGLFYYLRIIAAMCERAPPAAAAASPGASVAASWTLGVLTALLLGLGIAPMALIRLLQETVARL